MPVDHRPVDALPSLDEFLALCLLNDSPGLPAGTFPIKDSKKAQLSLSVDFEKLPPKHAQFLRFYLSGHSAAESARMAGYSPAAAAQQGHRLKSKYEGGRISELMNEQGLSMEVLLEGLREGCAALRWAWDPEQKRFVPLPDEGVRTSNRKIAFQLHGAMAETEVKTPSVLLLDLGGVVRPRPVEVSGEWSEGGAETQPAGQAVAAQAGGVPEQSG
jgi:hypothetical protein